MSQLRTEVVPPTRDLPDRRHHWPLAAAAAGVLGLLAALDPLPARAGTALTWAAVAALLLTAAGWRRWVESRVRSTAAHLVPLGLVVSAATVVHREGWVGWAGVALAAAGVAWMSLRERTVSSLVGFASLVPVLLTMLAAAGLEGRGAADVAGPAWLVVAGLGLALGRSTITR